MLLEAPQIFEHWVMDSLSKLISIGIVFFSAQASVSDRKQRPRCAPAAFLRRVHERIQSNHGMEGSFYR